MPNDKFKRALSEALHSEYEGVLGNEENHEFSPEFETKMNDLIRRKNRPFRRIFNKTFKRVACAAACVAVASNAVVMNSNADRKRIANLSLDVYSDHSDVYVAEPNENAPLQIEERYELGYDLSDYEMCFEDFTGSSYIVAYENGDKFVDFIQHTIDDYKVVWDTENQVLQSRMLDDYEALYFTDYEYYNLIWVTEDYVFALFSNLSENELIEIANSVQKVE